MTRADSDDTPSRGLQPARSHCGRAEDGRLAFLACPVCRKSLTIGGARARCTCCGQCYCCDDEIWRMLRAGRRQYFAQWIKQYEHVRQEEGRDYRDDPNVYLALPFAPASSSHGEEWAIRKASYRLMMARIVGRKSMLILDLGAGNCWLSYRLAQAGHEPVAVDLTINEFDGLGAARHYRSALDTLSPSAGAFLRLQAEMDALPFVEATFDMVVFNASFHYSTDYAATLTEAMRVLTARGRVIIVDSPVYHDERSGRQMVREAHDHFERLYGFRSDSVPGLGYLTYEHVESLGGQLGIQWEHMVPWYGWRWFLKPWMARVTGRREPAQFGIWIGRCP